ncbi:Leucine-rich repeat serine/threonine-protein kinase 2 like [Verticillium longisporum]|nr:Leucine-rich repeat serine/threonine-protein kinase 2 like [Verticillium longisporum]
MEDAQEAQVAFLDDLFSSKFAIHDVVEDDFFSSEEREIDTTSPEESDKQSSEDDLAELLELINSIKLLPGSSKISYATAGMFNGVNSHPIDTGAFFQVRKLDQPGHNRQIVAKYPRLDPARKGGGISRKNIEAIKLEIQALSHQPILDHPNVVDLLGFSWARMSAAEERSQIVPVLLLEFASHGTLRDYLCDNATSPAERLRLGKGLGEGLDALHKSGIVHGDLKLDNALVFDHPDGGVVAKLADFGSAVQLLEGGYQYRGGTPPWTAPEWRKSIEPWEQHAADIYSFGLLIWTLCLEGRNPFSGLSANEIEDRKTRDVTESDAVKSVADHYEFFRHNVEVSTELEQFELYLTSVICPRKAFRYTLRFDTHQRDLGAALSALSVDDFYSANEDQDESTSKESPLMLKEYKSINTYTKLTDMPEQRPRVV